MKFSKLHKAINNYAKMKQELPKVIANECVKFFGDAFKKEGWTDTAYSPWKKRKQETKKSAGKPVLIGTGALRRAVMTSNRAATFERIRFVVNLPYASIHNNGGTVQKSAHKRSKFGEGKQTHTGIFTGSKTTQKYHFKKGEESVSAGIAKYPKRQFMGRSKALDEIIRNKINLALAKIWE